MGLKSRHLWVISILLLSFLTQGIIGLCVEHRCDHSLHIRHAIRQCPERSHERRATSDADSANDAKFVIDLECHATSKDECDRVQETLAKAGKVISSHIEFKTPITVNASYLDFCRDLGECDLTNGAINIGQAYPAVSYLMQKQSSADEANITSMYPQALLKQYDNLPKQPNWTAYDMNAQFNSQIDWYFEGHGEIESDQSDFLNTVIHEFIHGLGFVSAWSTATYERFSRYDTDMPKFLTPVPLSPPDELEETSNNIDTGEGPQPFWGFVDFPLDQLMYTNDNISFSDVSLILNTWGSSNVMFASMMDMVNSWEASGKVQAMARQMYSYATSSNQVTWLLDNGDQYTSETSFKPFVDGSSLSHVDHDTYNDSSDYLMIYNARRGVSLQEMSSKYDNYTLGPLLLRALANIGYNVTAFNDQEVTMVTAVTQPALEFWEPAIPMVGTAHNPSPSISTHTDGPAHIPTSSSSSSSSSTTSSSDSSACSSPSSAVTISMLLLVAALFIFFL